MRPPADRVIRFDWSPYRAALFDLDGVLTSTAVIHAAAWKETFDDVLARFDADAVPFDADLDYRRWVDGRPRFNGVAAFLGSRAIELPWGDPADSPGCDTVCAVGNLKNERVTEILARDGAEAYPGSVALLDHLDRVDMAMAVVSSSANAAAVLAAAGIDHHFGARVDGAVAAEMGLEGKPSPATFLEAAHRLSVTPPEAVVLEDAVAGVEAGAAGGFGEVIGVDRHNDPEVLRRAGAGVVVTDLGELIP